MITDAQRSVEDAADCDAAQVVAVIQIGDQQLQYSFRISGRTRNVLDDGVEKRLQIVRLVLEIHLGDAKFAVGIDDRKIELVFVGIQIDEEIVDLIEHFLYAGIRAIDFIDHHNRLQLRFQRFHQNVTRLWQRAFARVHKQHDAVDNLEGALHFSAEITVAGCVDDVNLHVAISDAGGFGKNGNAALTLQVVRIHHAFDYLLVLAEESALPKHGIN